MITGGDLRQSRLDVGYKTFTISPCAVDCSFNSTNWEALNDATVVTIGAPIITTSSANGTITIQFSGQLNSSANVRQTLTEVIQLENGPITFN